MRLLCVWHAGTTLVTVLIDSQQPSQHITRSQTHASTLSDSYNRQNKLICGGEKSLLLLEAHLLSVCSVIHAVSRQQQHLHLLLQNAITEKNILQTPATLSNLLFIYAANTSKQLKINAGVQITCNMSLAALTSTECGCLQLNNR